MFKFIKEKFSNFRSRLTQINENEPLSKLSFVVILFLDIFVLVIIFQWLEDHTRQLTSPDQYIPYECQQIIINTDTNTNEQKIDLITSRITKQYSDFRSGEVAGNKQHEICSKLDELLKKAEQNQNLKNLLNQRQDLISKKYSLNSEINSISSTYDTVLLEKIANQPKDKSIMPTNANNIKSDIENKTNELNNTIGQIQALELQILGKDEMKALLDYIEWDWYKNKNKLESDLHLEEFFYPLKKLWMELLFLIPLFIIIILWSLRATKKNSWIQMLMSSHLLVVAFIPIFIKIINAIIDIIPKYFLEKIWKFLQEYNILAVWYYVIVLIAILIALLMIYVIQKKFFSKQRLLERRLIKWECFSCGKYLPIWSKSCPICGTKQMKKCNNCGNETFISGNFCKECWFELKK